MENEIITPSKASGTRFVYRNKQMNALGVKPSQMKKNPEFMWNVIKGGASELFVKKKEMEKDEIDESVDEFFRRRFGSFVADNLSAALVLGIVAGDSKKLSMQSMFPPIYNVIIYDNRI